MGWLWSWLLRHHLNPTTKYLHFTHGNKKIFTLISLGVRFAIFLGFDTLSPCPYFSLKSTQPPLYHDLLNILPHGGRLLKYRVKSLKLRQLDPGKCNQRALIFYMHIHHTSCPTTSQAKSQVCIIDVPNRIEGINKLAQWRVLFNLTQLSNFMQELQVFKLIFLLHSGSLHPQWRRGKHHDVKEVTVVTSEAGGELDMKAQATGHLFIDRRFLHLYFVA